MNSKKLIALLLSVLMIFSQVQGVFAIDFNQPAFNAEERIEIEGVEKDGELIFDLGPAIEEAERLEESNFNGSNGLEIGDEIISGPVRGTGEEITVQYKITAKMTGLNGGEFDWSVFEDENFVADLSFKNNSNKTIKSTPIAFNKENVAEGVNYTLKTDEVTTSDQMSPSIKINKIDNNLDIRAYYIKPSNPTQAEGVYKIEFEVIQIINPKVTIEWQNADGSPMIDANRPADTDLVNIASVGGIVNKLKFNLMAKDGVYNLLRPYKKGNETVRPLVRDRQIRTKLNQVADESKVTAELNGKADGKVTINGKEYAVATSYSKEEGFKYIFTYPAEGICLTKDALQKQFEAAANPMFDRVGSKKGVYIGHFDKAKKEVTVYIIDKTQGAKNISGTGLAAGLADLYENHNLVKVKVGNQEERDLIDIASKLQAGGMNIMQTFKTIFGADILNAVQAQGNTGKLADFIDKNVVLKLTIEQPGCGNAVIVEYKVSGKEAAASLLKDKLDPQDISVWVGDGINWKDGVKLKEANPDLQAILDKAKVKDLGKGGTEDNPKEERTSATKGKYTGNLLVTFEDGSTLVVENQDLYVRAENEDITDENDNWPVPKDGQKVTFNFDDTIKSFADASGNEPNPIVSTIKKLIKTHKTLTDADFPKVIKNTGYTDPVTWKGNGTNEGFVVSSSNNVFTASAVWDSSKCLLPDVLQKQFEQAANPMFAKVGSKKGVYIGHFDEAKKEVTVYIIDKTQGAKQISGTGLIAGLTALYKNNYLTKIKIGNEAEKDLKALAEAAPTSGMTVEQLFKLTIGADLLNAVQATGNKTGTLADFVNKTVVLKITLEQPGCGNAVVVEYKVSGKEAAASLLKDKLDPQDISVWVGDGINWKDGVKLKEGTVDSDGKLQALLDKATVTDESDRNSNKVGNYPGTLKLAFEDGSELKVEKQNLIVKEKILPSTDNNAPKDAIEVKFLLGEGVKVVKDGITTEGDKANPKLYATYKIKPGTDLEIYQHSQLRDTIFGLIGAEPNEGYTEPVTWKGNIVNNPNNYVVSKDNNVFTASATKTPAVCKTKDALKAEFEAAANDKFASVSSKPGIYSAVYDATTHKVTVTILDKTQEFKKLKGTGLVAGLFDLKEHNNVVAVQIGAQDRINLSDGLTMGDFAQLISFGIGTELNNQGVTNLQTLKDFAGKTVAVKLYIKEDGCDNEVSVTYYITGQLNDSDKDVIPYEPNDPNNPTDPQDPNTPDKDKDKKDVNANDFVRVAFKVDPNPSGTLTLENIVKKPVISALVRITKPQKTWADFTMPTTNDTDTYKFLKWEMPTNTVVANDDVAVAKFIKNGDKIGPNDTLPEGVHKVTLKQGQGVEDNEKYATYAVFDRKTLEEAGIVFAPVAKDGFNNPAWYDDANKKVENLGEVTITEDKVFEAKAEAIVIPQEEYIAVFNGNGGVPVTQKVTVKDGELVQGVTEPTREGYKFVKWVKLGTDKEFDITRAFDKDLLDNGAKNIIFTAVWEKLAPTPEVVHTVKFELNGHGKAIPDQKVKDGEKAKEPKTPTENGFTFEGWYSDQGFNDHYDFSNPVNDDIILYAKWLKNSVTPPTPPTPPTPKYSEKPIIDPIYDSDDVVTGRGVPGSTIEVQFPDGTVERVPVDKDGRWIVPVPYPLYDEQVVRARQIESGKLPSDWVSQRVRYDDEYWRERDRRDRRDREEKEEAKKPSVKAEPRWTPPALNARDHFSYIKGYGNNMFAPKRTITRAEVAMIFARLSINQSTVGAPQFKDVKAGDWYKTAVDIMARQGVIKGYEDGTFRPNQPITRREFAAIAARYAGNIDAWKTFRDVPPTDWAYTLINRVAGIGWINGYEDGTFRPNNNITRAEVVAIVNRMLNRKADKAYVDNNLMRSKHSFIDNLRSAWYFYDIYEAAVGHAFERQPNGVDEKWNRVNGQAFEIRER